MGTQMPRVQSSAVDHVSISITGLALLTVHVNQGPGSTSMTKLEIICVLLAGSCLDRWVIVPRTFPSVSVLLLFYIVSLCLTLKLTRNGASVWLIL